MILGDSTYCRIKTEELYKGKPGEPIVEGTTFGWVIHGGDYQTEGCLFAREVSDYEQLYSLDVLGVENRGENDQLDVYAEFKENVSRKPDGRYEVNVPWIPGSQLIHASVNVGWHGKSGPGKIREVILVFYSQKLAAR